MRQALRAFLLGEDSISSTKAWITEQGFDVHWAGRPHRRQVWLHIAASMLCAPLLVLSVLPYPGGLWMTSIFAVLLLTVVPVMLVVNWHETEYVVAGTVVAAKKGAFHPTAVAHDVREFEEVEVYVTLPQRIQGLASLRFHGTDGALVLTGLTLRTALGLNHHLELLTFGASDVLDGHAHGQASEFEGERER